MGSAINQVLIVDKKTKPLAIYRVGYNILCFLNERFNY